MKCMPMPSPNNTNRAGLYVPASWPWRGPPTLAMDSAIDLPSNGTRNRTGSAAGNRLAKANRSNNSVGNSQADSEFNNLSELVDILRKNLSPEEFAAFVELANDPDAHEDQADPIQASNAKNPVVPMTHGGDPSAPGYGGAKNYAGMRAQAAKDTATLNKKEAKDGLVGGALGAGIGGVAFGPLGAIAGGLLGSTLDDDKLASGQDGFRSIPAFGQDSTRNSFDAMFPDAKRIAMDGVQASPRRQAAMSSADAATFFAMFPDAARIGRGESHDRQTQNHPVETNTGARISCASHC